MLRDSDTERCTAKVSMPDAPVKTLIYGNSGWMYDVSTWYQKPARVRDRFKGVVVCDGS